MALRFPIRPTAAPNSLSATLHVSDILERLLQAQDTQRERTLWRDPPNHWRIITRLDAVVRVTAFSAIAYCTSRLNQHLAELIMNRDDVLVWLSFAWFVALGGAAIWVLFPL